MSTTDNGEENTYRITEEPSSVEVCSHITAASFHGISLSKAEIERVLGTGCVVGLCGQRATVKSLEDILGQRRPMKV
ncbi:conserved hypothetical protein [Histoplasma capsulatum var. duboisii H88]|uniref:Uncharacterized protein n=1 Tax=Ajellomyces capsulatus (strain H88) TaxID=544711 RepID=F0UF87_AJEC8|nr:conserved hypothetical protein [Histoplasma capsulatum var. duboisii H88]